MFDRRLLTNFNWPLLLTALVLSGIGLVNLYSATSSFDSHSHSYYFHAQTVWLLAGTSSLLVVTSIHYRHGEALSYWFYGLTVLLLFAVLFFGKKIAGHQSWLELGAFSFQPTELAKLGLIFGLSRNLSAIGKKSKAGLSELVPSLVLFLLPTILVILQGDLGSSLFFGLIYISMILVFGVRMDLFAWMSAFAVVLAVVGYLFFLSPYQKNRIKTFLNPEMDRRGAGYHLVQSKIAVGSGGFFGKGYLKGQTHKLKFIPERHTDFIFPVLAEEWGFSGSLVVMISFLTFLALGLKVASKTADCYGFFLSVGICALFFWHLAINLGGVLGLMPLTGVPLPFFSYGGSALLADWLGAGLLLNISMRRFMFT